MTPNYPRDNFSDSLSSQNSERLSAPLVLAVAATALLSFSGVVSETAMNVAFPTLMKDLGVATSTVQWLTTGYLLVLALIMPVSPFLKKRFDVRTLFFAAVGLFIFGTLVCIFAPHFCVLLATAALACAFYALKPAQAALQNSLK